MTALRMLLPALVVALALVGCNGGNGDNGDAADDGEADTGTELEQVERGSPDEAFDGESVPDLTGLTPEEVDQVAGEADIEIADNLHPEDGPSIAVAQDPEPGADLEPGMTVTVNYQAEERVLK
jgi:hypothetical protein